jgi:hypothetical protein
MGAGRTAGRTHGAQEIARLDDITRLHIDTAEVTVERHQTLSVIDDHGVAVEEEIPGLDDASRCGRDYRRAGGRGDVHA